ncbi:MAG TPA: hypothetical protein VNK04_06955 [Gemmataceae bacterium]|nr:hypothetical protein [Gemmataceae bacterium]
MKCKTVQTCLLGLERPDRPPPDAAAHLARCAVCQEWQQRLLQLEQAVPLLPVPPSAGKSRLLARIRAAPPAWPVVSPPRGPAAPEPPWVRHERRLRRLALASALTAALVLIAVGLWVWRYAVETPGAPRPAPAEDALLASLMRRNVKLATATTPRQRLETLAELANDLQGETRALAPVASADPADLDELALLYRRVVREGILVQAQALPAADRPAVLGSIARGLERVGSEAEELAGRVPANSARPLRDIAAAAREGGDRLRILMRGEKS